MDKTSKRLLLMAVVLAVVAGLGVYYFLANLERMSLLEHTEEVVVAVADVPARTAIRAGMLSVVRVPRGMRHQGATDTIGNLVGRITTAPLIAGEQVLLARLHADGERTSLSFMLENGYRALSVHINERIAVAYHIRPGDFVDVAVSHETASAAGAPRSIILLQNILVLAIGDETMPFAAAPPEAKTITLALRPEAAEQLIWAEDHGRIRLMLRAVADKHYVTTSGVNVNTIVTGR